MSAKSWPRVFYRTIPIIWFDGCFLPRVCGHRHITAPLSHVRDSLSRKVLVVQVDFAGIVQAIIIIVVVLVLTRPVGRYLVTIYFKEHSRFDALFGPLERALFRILGVNPVSYTHLRAHETG